MEKNMFLQKSAQIFFGSGSKNQENNLIEKQEQEPDRIVLRWAKNRQWCGNCNIQDGTKDGKTTSI